MRRLVQLLRQSEFHTFLFCLMCMLINWPFLAVTGKNGLISLYMYLLVLWLIFILLLFLVQRSLRDNTPGKDGDGEGGG